MEKINTDVLHLTKFDVAERQLILAIELFFQEADPVSIHTLSEAAAQILYDIGTDYGVKSMSRDYDKIRADRKKEWLGILHSSRNFFKHADRDKNEIHEFSLVFNDMSIIDAVNMYTTIKTKWVPESLIFHTWFGMKYPHLLIKEGSSYQAFTNILTDSSSPAPENKQFFSKLIRRVRIGAISVPNTVIYFGLTSNESKT